MGRFFVFKGITKLKNWISPRLTGGKEGKDRPKKNQQDKSRHRKLSR
jgi:hypothetical protein